MERYTRKDIDGEGYELEGCGCSGVYMPINDNTPDMIDKLGEIEDIEEKLGCPLTVFIKAHTQGVYCLDQKRGGLKWILRGFTNANNVNSNHLLGFFDDRLLYKEDDIKFNIYYWKDYKKTWWLKEDKSE